MSRAWFKLEQIQKRFKIFNSNMFIIDLGAAPGSWSKFVKNIIGKKGIIIGYDIKKINPISGITFYKENILNNNFINIIKNHIKNKKVDIIISDLSPNLSGITSIDIPKSLNLTKTVIKICEKILKINGKCIIKIFQHEDFKKIKKYMLLIFKKVKFFKPKASNYISKEIYILAIGYFIKI